MIDPRTLNLPQAHLSSRRVGHLLCVHRAAEVQHHVDAFELRRERLAGIVNPQIVTVIDGGLQVFLPRSGHLRPGVMGQKQNFQAVAHHFSLFLGQRVKWRPVPLRMNSFL